MLENSEFDRQLLKNQSGSLSDVTGKSYTTIQAIFEFIFPYINRKAWELQIWQEIGQNLDQFIIGPHLKIPYDNVNVLNLFFRI